MGRKPLSPEVKIMRRLKALNPYLHDHFEELPERTQGVCWRWCDPWWRANYGKWELRKIEEEARAGQITPPAVVIPEQAFLSKLATKYPGLARHWEALNDQEKQRIKGQFGDGKHDKLRLLEDVLIFQHDGMALPVNHEERAALYKELSDREGRAWWNNLLG